MFIKIIMIKKINNCEVCQSKNLFKVLDLGKHPLCDDLIKLKSKKKISFIKLRFYFVKNARQLIKNIK